MDSDTKRICFFNSTKPWGGGEKWHYDFAKLTREAGYTVFAVCNQPSELAERLRRDQPHVTILQTPINSLSFANPATLLKVSNFFRKNRIHTVVMALPQDMKLGGVAGMLAGTPERIYRRGIGVPTKDTALNRFLFKHAITKLIYNSESTKRTILAHNPDMIENERTHLVHCGFDTAEFDALPVKPMTTRRGNETVIGNAGRLTEQKGQKHLIKAARILKDKGLDIRVLIAGKGELEQELKTLVRDLDLEDTVEFLGFITDLKSFNAGLDIFALPSLWEGFCYAQVEAMTMGKPVVAFNTSSIPEVVADGETGILAEPGDTRSYAQALERLVADPDLRNKMGAAGRARVKQHFEMTKTLHDFLAVIEEKNGGSPF